MSKKQIKSEPEIIHHLFYKWVTPCRDYFEFIQIVSIVGTFLMTQQTVYPDRVNCFYWKFDGEKFILYCSIINGNESHIFEEINKVLKCNPIKEPEFKPENEYEIVVSRLKYAIYNTLSIQSIATITTLIDVTNQMKDKKPTKEDNLFLYELQSMGVSIADSTKHIFGISEKQAMFHYADMLRDYVANEISKSHEKIKSDIIKI